MRESFKRRNSVGRTMPTRWSEFTNGLYPAQRAIPSRGGLWRQYELSGPGRGLRDKDWSCRGLSPPFGRSIQFGEWKTQIRRQLASQNVPRPIQRPCVRGVRLPQPHPGVMVSLPSNVGWTQSCLQFEADLGLL